MNDYLHLKSTQDVFFFLCFLCYRVLQQCLIYISSLIKKKTGLRHLLGMGWEVEQTFRKMHLTPYAGVFPPHGYSIHEANVIRLSGHCEV